MSQLRINTVFTADGAQFFSTITKAKVAVNNLGASMASSLKGQVAAAFGVSAIAQMVRSTAQLAENIQRNAKTYGMPADEMQEWAFAATMADTSLEALLMSYKRMAAARREAIRNPDSEQADAFADFGIGGKKVAASTPRQLMLEVANAASGAEENSVRFAAALKLLGRRADEVLPALEALNSGIGANAPKMSDNAIAALADESDRLKAAWTVSRSLLGSLTAKVIELKESGFALNLVMADFVVTLAKGYDKMFSLTELGKHWGGFMERAKALYGLATGNMPPGQRGMIGPQVLDPFKEKESYPFSQDELQDINKTMAKAEEIQSKARFEALTQEQQLFELHDKRKKILEEISKLPWGKELADKRLELAETNLALANMSKDSSNSADAKSDKTKGLRQYSAPSDELIRVGNFLGQGAQMSLANIAAQQLEITRRALFFQERMAKALEIMAPFFQNNQVGVP